MSLSTAPVFKSELDSGQTSRLVYMMPSEVTATTSLHPSPKGKMEEQSILCSFKKRQNIPSPRPDWQLLMEEEDYKHSFVCWWNFSLRRPPFSPFCFEKKLDKDTSNIWYSASEEFLGTVSGLGTFTALRCFWGVRKNTSDPERRLRISPLCVFKVPSCPIRWVKQTMEASWLAALSS